MLFQCTHNFIRSDCTCLCFTRSIITSALIGNAVVWFNSGTAKKIFPSSDLELRFWTTILAIHILRTGALSLSIRYLWAGRPDIFHKNKTNYGCEKYNITVAPHSQSAYGFERKQVNLSIWRFASIAASWFIRIPEHYWMDRKHMNYFLTDCCSQTCQI